VNGVAMTFTHELVNYSRLSQVGNEAQTVLVFYIYASAHLKSKADDMISGILTGSQSAGKTRCQRTVKAALPEEYVFQTSAGSPKSFIYNKRMHSARYCFFSELQKFNDDWIEFFKSMSADDMDFVYQVTVRKLNGDNDSGFDVEEIRLAKRPYTITSAQELTDIELMSRLLRIPMDESKELNEAVVRFQLGDENVSYKGATYHTDIAKRNKYIDEIKTKFLLLNELESRGAIPDVLCPKEYVEVVASMVDTSRTNSRRHSRIIGTLLKTSRLLDYDPLSENADKIYIRPQDLFNVLVIYPVISTTIHEIDERAMKILKAILAHPDCDIYQIHFSLKQEDISTPGLGRIRQLLNELEEKGLIEIYRDVHKYRYRVTDNPFTPKIFISPESLDAMKNIPVQNPLSGVWYDDIRVAIQSLDYSLYSSKDEVKPQKKEASSLETWL